MPIRFRCVACNQLLTIARRKAGATVECPRCKREVRVPEEEGASKPAASPLLEHAEFDRWLGRSGPASKPSAKPSATATLSEPSTPRTLVPPSAATSPGELSPLPAFDESFNRPLPVRGGAIGDELSIGVIVAISAVTFALGLIVGRYVIPAGSKENGKSSTVASRKGPAVEQDTAPAPEVAKPAVAEAATKTETVPAQGLSITGQIQRNSEDGKVGDGGACVIVVPTNATPSPKIAALGLRPADQMLQNRPGREQLLRAGGKIVVADDQGEFRVDLVTPAAYHILILSKGQPRPPGQFVFPDEQAILGKYFNDVAALLSDRDFLLVTRDVKAGTDTSLRHTFGR